mmetsp:Transcript_7533/g.13620  ORF Transcript_7533/g.13620 Transcript_7533/m.13620 type:complete len:667 (-) Transcript_7533:39-2039(-)|eukprot:CAMPEP_0182447624 /NCGR_PEP_ID=MMETSP1172-20130603/18142_1 /TAXON_ID=708627 /ORGANISM="Timspurckia oligopyrenoides, Strain CCMP3278" /LENGTH=666 /DNA_ID=CAMNT_0024644131 /DNA_START=160 /DNA_END=2160 /DNA_ORIENTATION=+
MKKIAGRSSRSGRRDAEYTAINGTGDSESNANLTVDPLLPPNWWDMLQYIAPFFWPDELKLRIIACASLFLTFLNKICSLAIPLSIKISVDALTDLYRINTDSDIYGDAQLAKLKFNVFLGVFLYAVLRFLSSVFGEWRSYYWQFVSLNVTRSFSVSTFEHLHDLPLSYHLTRKTGEVLRVMDRGVSSLSTLMQLFVFTIGPTILELILTCAIFMHFKSISIAIVMVISSLLYVTFSVIMTQWRTQFRRIMNEKDNAVNSVATDSLLNFETVKYFTNEHYEVNRYREKLEDYQSASLETQRTLAFLNVGQNLIVNVAVGIGLLFAASRSVSQNLSVGEFVMVNQYILQLFQPLAWLGSAYRTINRAFTDLEMMMQLREISNEVADLPGAPEFVFKGGEVRFENVCFWYGDSDNPEDKSSGQLSDISFVVPPGKMLALVGETGSGKTTILKLLLRFYNLRSGKIIVDGQDIAQIQQKTFRNQIGFVSQDAILFNDTLRANITYGNIHASDALIWDALRVARLDLMVESLPLKLETMVGERGLRLSGGEKQRLGIARMVLKNPGLILLDEASSALDTTTERAIQMSLREVCKNKTSVVVAHRLSTIVHADEILVLSHGRVQERGTHAQLIEQQGNYYKMWMSQLEGSGESPERLSELSSLGNGNEQFL